MEDEHGILFDLGDLRKLEDILFFLSLGKEIYGKPMKDRLSREKMK